MAKTLIAPKADLVTANTPCPHCKKIFVATVNREQPPRLQGAKCPNCRLFVPVRHIMEFAVSDADKA